MKKENRKLGRKRGERQGRRKERRNRRKVISIYADTHKERVRRSLLGRFP